MKKMVMLLGALALSATAQAGNFYFRAGLDALPTYDEVNFLGLPITEKDGEGFAGEIALEYTFDVTSNWELGFGIAAQVHADIPEQGGGTIAFEGSGYYESFVGVDSIPLYVTSKYNFNRFNNGSRMYLKADLGYSFVDGGDGYYNYRSNNGIVRENVEFTFGPALYAGIGLGVEYNNFLFDLMYKVNTLTLEAEGTRTVSGRTTHISDSIDVNYSRITASIGYKF